MDLIPNPFVKDNGSYDDELKAYRIVMDIKFDREGRKIAVKSYNMEGFEMSGTDLFAMIDQVPDAIAKWFHEHYQTEVSVIPLHSTFYPKSRRVDDDYVVIPMRSIVATVRGMEPKP